MVAAVTQPFVLDSPTLAFAAVCIAGFLGLFLIVNWLQQREVRALAWWGSAYLIGASAIALWGSPGPLLTLPPVLAGAMIFIACGMLWSGMRLFYGRRLSPLGTFAGAFVWLTVSWLPGMAEGQPARLGLGAVVVAAYTFFIAFELGRERRKPLYSRTAAIVMPGLYAGIFLMPLAMRAFLPESFSERWLNVFAIGSILYAVGAAFIVMLMVKDHSLRFYRKAATTDSLTGLMNRGAFLEAARKMQVHQGARGAPVTLLMFDLDKFKSINDRFGHATGDNVLRVFAQVARASVRATDIVGRLGGEEFVAIVPEPMEGATMIAERLRAAFEIAGVTVDTIAIGATVSIGLATSYRPESDLDSLLLRADEALYRAKNGGRNRYVCADEQPGSEQARALAAARRKPAGLFGRKLTARRPEAVTPNPTEPAPAG
jgi:diguanylate cyclase (GGDEF)-like protein